MNENIWSIIINIASSVIYDIARSAAKSGMNVLTQNKVRQQVGDKVHAELEKLEGENLLFQSAAFVNYVNDMKPIQKIVQWVMEPEKHYDTTEREFMVSVLDDTVRYLQAQDMTVGIAERYQLEEFYSKLVQISREVLYSYLDTSDKALGDMIQRVLEADGQRTALEIRNVEKRLERQANQNHNAIESQLKQLTAGMQGLHDNNTSLTLHKISQAYPMPYKYQQGSDKRTMVQQITSNLRSRLWIHIYGKMFTGKTQVLIRVAERLGSYVWIGVEESSFLKMQPAELSMEEDTVIILDGIPNIARSGVREKCLQLLEECRGRKCRLITSGYEDIAPYLKGYVGTGELICMQVEGLSSCEVDEIAQKHGAPARLLQTKGYQNFVEICKSLPPVVMEVIHRMEDNGWQFDDEVFTAIMQRKTDSLTEQMVALFQESVKEEETRHLYYRMLYSGQTISVSWLRPLAEIPRRIPDVDMHIEKLRNRWYYKEGKVYQSPNMILEQYAEEQLEQQEKEQINRFLVKETMSHPLDMMDVSNLFKYYNRLEEYDAEGILCVQLMEKMIHEGEKDYFLHPENFWTGMPFPDKMSPLMKCHVRLEQVFFKAWKGDKDPLENLDINWLWELAAVESMCRELIIAQFMRLSVVCVDDSLELFQEVLEMHPEFFHGNEEFRRKLALESKENILCTKSLFVAYNEMLCLYIKTREQLEQYVALMEKHFIQEQWRELEDAGEMDAMVFHMLSQVTKVNESEMTECTNLIKRLYILLDDRKQPKLWRSVLHFYLVQLQTAEGYQKAWEAYRTIQSVVEENPILFCEIIDTMARIAHDNGDEDQEKLMFGWEMNLIPQMDNEEIHRVMVDSCLLYLEKLTVKNLEEVEKVHQVLQHIAGHISPSEEFLYIDEKLEAAYWMKIYQLGQLEQNMCPFILFVKGLLEQYETKDDVTLRAILTKMVHALGYISGVLMRGAAPDKTGDGSEYASPHPRMFWNQANENDVVQYWKPGKRELAYYICAALAEQCGETELATELFEDMLRKVDFWSNEIMYLYRLDAYMELKLLELGKLDRLVYVMAKNYGERTLPPIEQEGEFLWIAREILLLSLYILQLYRQDKYQGVAFCRRFLDIFCETEFRLVPRTYYQEYRKVLGLVIEEDADFDLLKDAFYRIQKREELGNMDSSIFPLLLLEAPLNHRDMLKRNLGNAVKTLKHEDDFMIVRMMERILRV